MYCIFFYFFIYLMHFNILFINITYSHMWNCMIAFAIFVLLWFFKENKDPCSIFRFLNIQYADLSRNSILAKCSWSSASTFTSRSFFFVLKMLIHSCASQSRSRDNARSPELLNFSKATSRMSSRR